MRVANTIRKRPMSIEPFLEIAGRLAVRQPIVRRAAWRRTASTVGRGTLRDATLLAGSLVVVYAMMAMAEEPWLETRYGRSYLDYKAEVPRFFNLRHAAAKLSMFVSNRPPSLAKHPPSKQ